MQEDAYPSSSHSKPSTLGLKLLVLWNVLCILAPVFLYVQPSQEPSIAQAVVLLVFLTPALGFSFLANLIFWLKERKTVKYGLSFYLTLVFGTAAIFWTIVVFLVA